MSNSIDQYKQKLGELIPYSFGNMTDNAYSELIPLITQDVLDDAYNNKEKFISLFQELGLNLESRTKKKIERIELKKQGKQRDIAFKVNSDFLAFRIPVELILISKTVEEIQNIVKKNNGYCFIRNSIYDNDKLVDIVQYLFVYIPEIGYIVELQIGHKFAFYVFSIDSMIRDRKNNNESIDDLIDFWDYPKDSTWDNCLYIKIRSKILNPDLDIDIVSELRTVGGNKFLNQILIDILMLFI